MLLISRRTWLARIAGSSAALAAGVGYMREALAQGEIKTGVARASGVVRINGKPAAVGAQVNPGDVVETARVLAETRGIGIEEVARQTTANFFRLFAKVPRPAVAAA